MPHLYNIGITLLPGVGDVNAKNLVAYCGSAEAVFREKKARLKKIPGIGAVLVNSISDGSIQKNALARAEEEIHFIEKHKITPLFFTEKSYPKRLKQCNDGPVILYYKGTADLNAEKIISVVGTRSVTEYGKQTAEKIIEGLSCFSPIVVSGLALGVDICAHRASLKNNLQTVGVLGHGLERIYPDTHKATAKDMIKHGGLLTEFLSNTKMAPEFFPRRNRIIAGMADAVIVIESRKTGGSLITAEIANSYNRDVFAIPGRINDTVSEGCNFLIRTNRAALARSAEDIAYSLGWKKTDGPKKQKQQKLFIHLSEEEKALQRLLREKNNMHIDDISIAAKFPMSKTATLLLNMEFSGVIRSLPGKVYCLND